MRKIALIGIDFVAAGLLITGCATTGSTGKKDAVPAAVTETEKVSIACGTWNDAKTEYSIDLSKITTGDSTLTLQADGSLVVQYTGDWSSIMIPIPYTDADFMSKMTHMKMTVSCDKPGTKKIAWKLSTNTETAWGNGGGATGQGQFVVGYQFMDYSDPWAETKIDLWFNGDSASLDPFKKYKGLKAIAMCNNKSPVGQLTFIINKIVFSAE